MNQPLWYLNMMKTPEHHQRNGVPSIESIMVLTRWTRRNPAEAFNLTGKV